MLLGTQNDHGDLRAPIWQRPHPRGWAPRGPPGWSGAPPPRRAYRGAPEQRHWRPGFRGQPEMGSELTKELPKSKALGLEVPCAAQERPSCGRNSSTSPVPSRSALHDVASGVNIPRHSAGRPRKVSRRSAEKTSRRSMGRPRKVSQGTMDAKQSNSRQNRGERSWKAKDQGSETANDHHSGRGRTRESMGSPLKILCVESGIVLGGDGPDREGLPRKRREAR